MDDLQWKIKLKWMIWGTPILGWRSGVCSPFRCMICVLHEHGLLQELSTSDKLKWSTGEILFDSSEDWTIHQILHIYFDILTDGCFAIHIDTTSDSDIV